jgi:hypothetical protein
VKEKLFHDVVGDDGQCCVWPGVGGGQPEDAALVPHKHQDAPLEIPKYGPQQLEPLDIEHHIERPEGQAVAGDVEHFIGDRDGEVGAAAGAGQAVAVGDSDAEACGALEHDTGAFSCHDV